MFQSFFNKISNFFFSFFKNDIIDVEDEKSEIKDESELYSDLRKVTKRKILQKINQFQSQIFRVNLELRKLNNELSEEKKKLISYKKDLIISNLDKTKKIKENYEMNIRKLRNFNNSFDATISSLKRSKKLNDVTSFISIFNDCMKSIDLKDTMLFVEKTLKESQLSSQIFEEYAQI